MSFLLMILPNRNKTFLRFISPEIFHVRYPSFSKYDTNLLSTFLIHQREKNGSGNSTDRSSNFVSATNCSFVCGWWENPNQRFQRSKWRKNSDHQVQPWHIVVLNTSIFHPQLPVSFFLIYFSLQTPVTTSLTQSETCPPLSRLPGTHQLWAPRSVPSSYFHTVNDSFVQSKDMATKVINIATSHKFSVKWLENLWLINPILILIKIYWLISY